MLLIVSKNTFSPLCVDWLISKSGFLVLSIPKFSLMIGPISKQFLVSKLLLQYQNQMEAVVRIFSFYWKHATYCFFSISKFKK